MKQATTISTWAQAIARALDAAGHDAKNILAEAGINASHLGDAHQRIPQERMTRLWQAVRRVTGDESFAFKVADHCQPTDLYGLAFALQSSTSLADELKRVVRFSAVISTSSEVIVERNAHSCRLYYRHFPGLEIEQMATEALMACAIRFSNRTSRKLESTILLNRSRPANPQPWLEAFGTSVRFGCPYNGVEYPTHILNRPLNQDNGELARSIDGLLEDYLLRMARADLPAQVSEVILRHLPYGEVPQGLVASELGMSVRNLHRHLLKHHTSFKELLDQIRLQQALGYLRQSRYSVNQVGYLLGFHEPSSFNRAFRRWAGLTPGQWRQQQTGSPVPRDIIQPPERPAIGLTRLAV